MRLRRQGPPAGSDLTFENYKKVFTNKYLLIGFKNTIIILVVSLIFNVMLGTITAFIIERFEFRGKKFVVGLFFLGMLIPSFVTEISISSMVSICTIHWEHRL